MSGNVDDKADVAAIALKNGVRFSGRLRCESADTYDGKDVPPCSPLCESCVLKWCTEETPS